MKLFCIKKSSRSLNFWAIFLIFATFTSNAKSACTRNSNFPFREVQNVLLDMGTVIVPDDPEFKEENGPQVIKLQRFTINRRLNAWRCTNGRGSLIGQISCDTCPDFDENTYFNLSDDERIIKTSIPGIGIRISRQALEGARRYVTYPDNGITINGDNTPDLNSAEFVVEFLKIAENVNSGVFKDDITFTYRGNGNLNGQAVLRAQLVANSILVSKSSCKVDYPNVVKLPTLSVSDFSAINTTKGRTEFEMTLSCGPLNIDNPDGDDLSGFSQNPAIAFSFDYEHDSNIADRGAMINTANNGASGVAIQFLQSLSSGGANPNTPVLTSTKNTGCIHFTDPNCSANIDENWISMGTLEEIQQSSKVLYLAAQYLQTENTVTAGSIQSRANFTVVYY